MSSNLSRNITSRKVFLSLVAAATVAVASLASGPSDARGFIGGHPFMGGMGGARPYMGGGRTLAGGGRPGAVLRLQSTGRLPPPPHLPRAPRPPHLPRPPHPPHLPIPIKFPHPEPPPFHHHHDHHHHHHHWVFRGGHWIVVDEDVVGADPVSVGVVSEGAVSAAPVVAPCDCLTKTYTPTGLVVFADICTKESASAPALSDHADATQAPTTAVPAKATPISEVPTAPNYAGRTYQDYLAANPQAAPPQADAAP